MPVTEGAIPKAAEPPPDPQTVFSVISAIDQWPSWDPDVKSVTVQGAGPTRHRILLEVGAQHPHLHPPGSRKTLDKGIRSILSHLKTEAERRAAMA